MNDQLGAGDGRSAEIAGSRKTRHAEPTASEGTTREYDIVDTTALLTVTALDTRAVVFRNGFDMDSLSCPTNGQPRCGGVKSSWKPLDTSSSRRKPGLTSCRVQTLP